VGGERRGFGKGGGKETVGNNGGGGVTWGVHGILQREIPNGGLRRHCGIKEGPPIDWGNSIWKKYYGINEVAIG